VNYPNPWPGGTWRLRDIIDYELIASEALVRMLAEQRETYVGNFARLGRKSVRLGETEAPYAYVIPAGQRDAHAVARLVEVLRLGGVEVGRATAPFAAGGRSYGAGSYVVRMAQPYRAHAKDLLEPQRFPKQEQYPGGPEVPPYDVAGWTLPYQLGVRADLVDSAFAVATGPVATVDVAEPASHCAAGTGGAALDASNTGCYAAAFAALRRGRAVELAAGRGRVAARALPRIALYKPWTANMDEGWTRWVFEQYGVPYTNVTDADVRGGTLAGYDVLVVPDMTVRQMRAGMSERQVPAQYAGGLGDAGVGAVRAFVERGGRLVLLDRASGFAADALGLAVRLTPAGGRGGEEGGGGEPPAAGAGARRATTPAADSGGGAPAPAARPYAPGSILRVLVDAAHPVATGMPDTAAVYFTNSTTLDVGAVAGARVIARYPAQADSILMSGYLSGGAALAGKAAAADAPLGRGRVVMFGFRPQYRGQSVGTFRMLFNALLAPADRPAGQRAER
jgi:ribosomal protein S18 acetylase RimI-like enzyme